MLPALPLLRQTSWSNFWKWCKFWNAISCLLSYRLEAPSHEPWYLLGRLLAASSSRRHSSPWHAIMRGKEGAQISTEVIVAYVAARFGQSVPPLSETAVTANGESLRCLSHRRNAVPSVVVSYAQATSKNTDTLISSDMIQSLGRDGSIDVRPKLYLHKEISASLSPCKCGMTRLQSSTGHDGCTFLLRTRRP